MQTPLFLEAFAFLPLFFPHDGEQAFTPNDEKVQLKQFSGQRNDDISEALNANKVSTLRVFPVSILGMGKIAVALA